ncbi:MAG TPA: hypothetical protein VG435_12595 [Acidimicrobiales bacterium]|nr:hypothetical protein [Acidimicrobiales bacterium]
MDGVRSWFARHYGASPGHLVLLLLCFALAGYVASLVAQVPQGLRIAVWFVGAAIVHDMILWPLYTLADRVAVRLHPAVKDRRAPLVPWVNHVRVPVVLSGILLAISFPLVLGWSNPAYRTASGLSPSPYTDRWLVITAVLAALSLLVYLGRLAWAWFGGARR